jgi:flavin reductase (DIM6/NTAB) family NADH-FMN oxidoreductase RutF
MKKITSSDLKKLHKIPRLNLVNSCTGYKSCNLIATKSKNGISNVAIFSSVTHLGSNPAMLGFIIRPATVPRGTYQNIKDLEYFTVNHVTENMIADAHHTSANYEESISEFDKTNLEEEYHDGIETPFVKKSPVQLLCKYLNEYEIKENNTIHLIASIEAIFYKENLEGKEMWLQLDKEKIVTVNGLDGYCVPILQDRLKYARIDQPTESFLTEK